MPHFGHMDPDLKPDEAALLRSRLHLRCGRRRIREQKTADGIATLYDALLSGIRWLAMTNKSIEKEWMLPTNEVSDDSYLIGIIKNTAPEIGPDIEILKELTAQVLADRKPDYDADDLLRLIDRVMTRLGVLPFDENSLPPETPDTF